MKKNIWMKNFAIFGSGSGSNAENIYEYFLNSKSVKISCICTNNRDAGIVKRAKKLDLPIIFLSKTDLNTFYNLQKSLKYYEIDYIILAGFLLKIPALMVHYYNKKIINIHPSLLPKYGGKGMYGRKIHETILAEKEYESGITIHFVNQNYDEGEVILQKKCSIDAYETVKSLEKKIHNLEFIYFPKAIEKILI